MSGLRIAPLSPGEVRVVPYPSGRPPRRSILVVDDGGEVRAYWNVCAHLPIPLDGGSGAVERDDAGRLVCSTHGAAYVPRTGACEVGPCVGAHLLPVPVERREDALVLRVDLSS